MNIFEAEKKLIEVSYDVKPPLHVPFIVGNECFVLTQQDTRRIEDMRFYTYSKLGPNGQLLPIDNNDKPKLPSDQLLTHLAQQQQQFLQQKQGQMEKEFYFNRQNSFPQTQNLGLVSQEAFTCPNNDVIMANAQQGLRPTIDQQLNWDKAQSSTTFPFHQTVGSNTNTTLDFNRNEKCLKSALKQTRHCSVNTTDSSTQLGHLRDQDTCPKTLGARDEIKRLKIIRFSNDC